jgi:hypothetical protein
MSRATNPTLRGSFLGAVLRAWNPAMRVLLGSPVHWPLSRWFAVLSWTGRKTGRRYSTPVSYVREGTTVWLTTGDEWWHNFAGGAPVAIRLGGRWYEGGGMAVIDRVESMREHRRIFATNAWFRRLAGIPGRVGGPDSEALDRALAAGRVLIRIELKA